MKSIHQSGEEYTGEVIEVRPIASCFSAYGGTRQFYSVRVSNPQCKGYPWAVATLGQDLSFKIDSCWMRSAKSAYREFRSCERDISSYMPETPKDIIKKLTY